MKKIIKCYVSLALSLFLINGCSSGSPTTPNNQSLTNLKKLPSTTPENEVKKVNLSGRVVNSLTGKPIENASVIVYAITNDDVMKSIKNGLKLDTNPSPSPGISSSPLPVTSASPVVSPVTSPSATSNPMPFLEENEEKSLPVKPSAKPTVKPSAKPVTTKSVKESVAPSDNPTPSESDKADTKEEISTDSLISALTTLKLNDLTEYEGKTGNDGKFWINKVPEANIIITVNAPNYKAVSIFNADISAADDIALDPLDTKDSYTSVIGSVVSATNNAVDNAVVSSSYIIGESYAVPVATNSMGDFRLDDIGIGERSLFATVRDETGKIVSMGHIDFDVKKNDKIQPLKPSATPKPKVSATPEPDKSPVIQNTDNKSNSENEEETKGTKSPSPSPKPEVKRDKSIPLIKINAVTEYINLKGKITSSESTTLKAINVYVDFKKKGLPREEVFLSDKQIEGSGDNFDISLPKLENGYSYHLEFVAVNKKGTYIYHHQYNLKKDSDDLKVSFLPPISIGRTDFINKDGEKLPVFSWPTVEGVSFYRVSLDKVDKDNNITTLWKGITPVSTAVYPISTGDGKLNSANNYYWSVEAIKEENSSPLDKLKFSKTDINTWTDLSRSPNMEFKVTDNKDEDIEEIDSKKEGQ